MINPLLILAAIVVGKIAAERGAPSEEKEAPDSTSPESATGEPSSRRARAYREPPDMDADPSEPEPPKPEPEPESDDSQLSSTGQSTQLSSTGQLDHDPVEPDEPQEGANVQQAD